MNGKLFLVSVGPGFIDLIPPLAQKALSSSQAIVGYELYLKWIAPWIKGKEIHNPPLTQERERAQKSIELAREGKQVSLVSSGDIGIYAMATLVFELMEEIEPFKVEVIPGISAANACASLLGAPLSHDYATLSLSDLLCPWEWIEKRAEHIAQADLAVAFYNVQSKSRQEGVYQIVRIMLKHKSSKTWCGVIRNAYREDQKIQMLPLEDLLKQRFDMLTSIIIGNRFTRKKGNFLYTPRGYQGWQSEENDSIEEKTDLRQNACWVFSGTSDGNHLAEQIRKEGYSVVVSAATDYGMELVQRKYPSVSVTGGNQGIAARSNELNHFNAKMIVDATHPFAQEISKQLIQISQELDIPYIRFERPGLHDSNYAIPCESMEKAAQIAIEKGKRVFLATGSKDLSTFLNTPNSNKCDWFVRMTPDSKMIQRVVELGIPHDHICAMQGPFSQSFNEALWSDWQIDCVITKDSGEAGGYEAKLEAAKSLSLPLITIQRPQIDYPNLMETSGEVLEYINNCSKTF